MVGLLTHFSTTAKKKKSFLEMQRYKDKNGTIIYDRLISSQKGEN